MALFGTDGVRGIANKELDAPLAFNLGRVAAYVFAKNNNNSKMKILIGTDTRISCDMLESAIIAGILSAGSDAYCVGVVPTPCVAYLAKKYNMDAGIMISASHNPARDNGIKFFDGKGYKLKDEIEKEIGEIILSGDFDKIPKPIGENIGRRIILDEALVDYEQFLESQTASLEGLKVGLDCANGSLSNIAPVVLKNLGADVFPIFYEPNGININDNCGSTHMKALQEHVKKNGLDIGIAFDGDGDRCLAVDEHGNILDGDEIMSICALNMQEKGKLKNNTIVATVMSNLGLKKMCAQHNINMLETKVGDRYVLEKMLEEGHNLGGEQSGHIIFLDYATSGDGLLCALQILGIMKEKGEALSLLNTKMKKLPQTMVNAKIDNTKKFSFAENKEIAAAIKTLEEKYQDNGRILIRPSGTEALVRVMIEGDDENAIAEDAKVLAKLMEETL